MNRFIKPADRSDDMELLIEAVFGRSIREAVLARECMGCDGDAIDFKDELSVKEYSISGLCQHCQDELFADDLHDKGETIS